MLDKIILGLLLFGVCCCLAFVVVWRLLFVVKTKSYGEDACLSHQQTSHKGRASTTVILNIITKGSFTCSACILPPAWALFMKHPKLVLTVIIL